MAAKTDLYDDILRVAGELFMKQSYAATSIKQIAKAAGCTTAALYYYFEDGKESILRQVIDDAMPDLASYLEPLQDIDSLHELILRVSLALGEALVKTGFIPELKLLKDNRGTARSDMQKSPLCFQSVSYGEISVNSGKIIGSAQKRWHDGLLQQGSIPLLADRENTSRVFRITSHRGPDNPLRGLKDMAPDLDTDRLKDAIRASFEEMFDVSFIISGPSKEEVSLARELETQKYSSRLWTFNR